MLGRLHAQRLAQQEIGFADELHVAVFDAVVDHLDEMAGAFGPDPVAAGRSILDLGGDRLEDRLDVRPRRRVAAGHDRRPLEGPSSPPETPVPMKSSPLAFERRVRRVESGKCELPPSIRMSPGSSSGTSSSITWSTGVGLDHDHDLARRLERRDQFLRRMGADDLLPLGSAREERVDPRVVRLNTATVKPWLSMFSTRFSPITARPISPMSAVFALDAMLVFSP